MGRRPTLLSSQLEGRWERGRGKKQFHFKISCGGTAARVIFKARNGPLDNDKTDTPLPQGRSNCLMALKVLLSKDNSIHGSIDSINPSSRIPSLIGRHPDIKWRLPSQVIRTSLEPPSRTRTERTINRSTFDQDCSILHLSRPCSNSSSILIVLGSASKTESMHTDAGEMSAGLCPTQVFSDSQEWSQ